MGVAVLIELKNYSFSYDGKKQILNNINLKVKQGEFVAVTGLSGCGKTTLTRVLNGLCPNFYQGEAEGDYRLYNSDAKNMSISEFSRYWGSVFQDPRSQFLAKRVRDELVIAMENACEDRFVMQEKLKKTADSLDIENLLDREMMFLSSGEKQKVAIGSVFCTYPKGFVLDEPSANLDNAATRSQHLARLIFEGPDEILKLTANTQPAIMTTSVAALRALENELDAVDRKSVV